MNAPAQPIHPDKSHELTGHLRALRDPVVWAGQKFPSLRLDGWQSIALRLVADPPKDADGALINLHAWWTARQMGKSQSQGLLVS